MKSRLLKTDVETAEERRVELLDPQYRERVEIRIRRIFEYQTHPDIDTNDVRGFPDGLEAVLDYSRSFTPGKDVNYVLLILEGRKQIIDFLYKTDREED